MEESAVGGDQLCAPNLPRVWCRMSVSDGVRCVGVPSDVAESRGASATR
jgi:hypothetical protein